MIKDKEELFFQKGCQPLDSQEAGNSAHEVVLSVENVTKTYQGVVALDKVSVSFWKGELHALVGENGAGKSTLIKIITGHTNPDGGCFSIHGQTFEHISPHQAKKHGVGAIYQDPHLAPDISVAENVFLGRYPGNRFFFNRGVMEQRTAEIFKELGIEINPKEAAGNLSAAQKQFVEIAKAAVQEVKLLILDEPTAPLTNKDARILYDLIERLKAKGVTIVYISHRLNEVYSLSDRITVMRDGKTIATGKTYEIPQNELIYQMVGRELTNPFPPRTGLPGEVVLQVKNLSRSGTTKVSFSLRRGEILGMAGLTGCGRTEVVRMLFGADKKTDGEIVLNGEPVTIDSPQQAIAQGIGFLPENRNEHGLFMNLSIQLNISLPILRYLSRFFLVDRKREKDTIDSFRDALSIKTPTLQQPVCNLSGGNQQKVVVSKWLVSSSQILVFDEPTQGIDVGAKFEIYQMMNQMTEQGISIIMVSSEMEELIHMSDRILVLHDGQITGILEDRDTFTQERIMELASYPAEKRPHNA
jgi:ribose transport system ATP-binding protein